MQYCYFQIAEDYLKKPFLSHFFPKKTSVKQVEKKFSLPMKHAGMEPFHCHEIKENLFHIALIGPGESTFFNCFYEAKQGIFFLEEKEPWIKKIKQCALWQHLTPVDASSTDYQLLTSQDLLRIINH